MQNLLTLAPEMGLTVLAFLVLMADVVMKGRSGRTLIYLAIVAAGLGLGLLALAYNDPAHYQGVGTLWAVDPLSLFFKVLTLGATLIVLVLTLEYRPPEEHAHPGSYAALLLFAAVGMMLLVSATDLLLIFLALELVSLSSFILVGFERGNKKSTEGAIKYYLIGAFSSAILVYGISLFYGAAGTTRLVDLPQMLGGGAQPMFVLACLLITVGFGFKISMVPFHLWVPDAYEGAPAPITAFLSVAPKIAGLAVMLRVFTFLVPHASLDLTALFSVLAILTMTVGNLTAIFQNDVKRLLAYSSIAQAGYLLIGFVTGDTWGREGLLLYSLAYLFMNIGAFAVVIVVGNEEGYSLEAYDGLGRRNFGLALVMFLFLLSLAGIPPMAGFIGKFYLFAAAIKGKFYWLAVFGVLNSVVSVYYYMRIAYHMFFREPRTLEPAPVGPALFSTLALTTIAVLLIGLYPEPFLGAVALSAQFLPLPPLP